jgi:flagellar motor switch protein FliN/FliY
MTPVLRDRSSVRDAATAAASAACAALAVPAVLDAALTDTAPEGLLPPGDARAVSVSVRGSAAGTLVLLLSGPLAEAITDGPLGAQDLVSALTPALADAGAALGQYCGGPLEVEAAHEVEAGIALVGMAEPGRLCAAVPMRVGADHVATLALLAHPALADSPGGIPQPRGAAAPHDFAPLGRGQAGATAARSMDLLHDVEMGVTAELGRTRMTVRDLLSLTPGAVVELDRAAGSPVDVLVNGTLIARGEVVVIDEEFGIRISEIIGLRTDETTRR